MTQRHNCPKCGNILEVRLPKSGGGALAAALILGLAAANLYTLKLLKGRQASPETAPPETVRSETARPEPADISSYARAAEPSSPCGVCLAEAQTWLREKQEASMKIKAKDMVLLQAGEYQVGSPDGVGDPDEHPRRGVWLDSFYMDQREVTNYQYAKFSADNPQHLPEWAKPGGIYNIETGKDSYYRTIGEALKAPENPVVGVTWANADAYCRRAGKRLPTEAEWEAAARGGSGGLFSFGDPVSRLKEYAWYEDNASAPRQVGTKKPNDLGLYDMHGNVWEWVYDRYKPDYYMNSPKRNPGGPEDPDFRDHVIRGGSWAFDADSARAANRASTSKPNDDIGFRCAVSQKELLAGLKEPGAVR